MEPHSLYSCESILYNEQLSFRYFIKLVLDGLLFGIIFSLSYTAVVAPLAIILIRFDGGIVSYTVSHILDVITDLTNAYFCTIKVNENFIYLVNKVVNIILPMKITETAVKNLIAQKGVFVCRHEKDEEKRLILFF